MGRPLKSVITKRRYHSGFGMVEILLALMIVGMISIVSMPVIVSKPLSTIHAKRIIQYQVDQTQLRAIAYAKRQNLPFYVDYTELYYNAQGNINHAKSGKVSYPYSLNVTFYLGYGRYAFQ